MRIMYLANNYVGWKVAEFLVEQTDDTIVGCAIHPKTHRKYGKEILQTLDLSEKYIFDGSELRNPDTLKHIAELDADIALSIFFGYILKPPFINLFSEGVINLHPAYLPYNRGSYPNVWSIIEQTPAGATLHYIDAGIDTGKIISQKQVEVEPIDTGKSLYKKLEDVCLELFQNTWKDIQSNSIRPWSQSNTQATHHRKADVDSIDEIHLDEAYNARDLINILRARTFPPHKGAYFYEDGHRINIRISLEYDDHPDKEE